jgi:hypothetical protein
MTRTRASAKNAGTAFETLIASHLAEQLADDRIERRARTGGKDRGDIAGVRLAGRRLTIECKNVARLNLPGWITEAQTEADNDSTPTNTAIGIVIHKRRGTQNPARQYVTMTVAELTTIIKAAQEQP